MRSWLVARTTFLEALRRKDFYALLILLGLYALIAKAVLRQRPDDAEVHRLLFSLGLTFGFASAAILVVVLAAHQVPKEIAQGTILPLLARPISRQQFLFGKFLACWLVGCISLLCFLVLIRLVVPAPERINPVLFLQTIALKAAGLAALSAITLMLSLFLPESLNITLSLGYYFLWGLLFSGFQRILESQTASWTAVLERVLYIFPHLEVLNISRVCLAQSDPLAWTTTAALIVYGAGYVLVALLVATNLFERRWV